jgi:glycosyltransferase involved in cell wall biosynthesis
MNPKKRILFILPSLKAGGAERVISFISQRLNSEEFEAKLIVLGFEKDAVYKVDNIEVEFLNKSRLISAIPILFLKLFKENKKPVIVLGSISHVNILLGFFSLFFNRIKFVGREASVITKMNEFTLGKSNKFIILIKLLYPRLDAIICQSYDMVIDFNQNFNIERSKLKLINNPITAHANFAREEKRYDGLRFVTVGRLSEEKGHLRILSGLAKIKKYNFHYHIIGSGVLKEVILAKSKEFGIFDKISYTPYTFKVLEEVSKCDYFIQGSFVEGFPNALLESCTVGTPVIAFDAVGGTKEIVEVGTNGFIVKNEDDFAMLLNDVEKLNSIDRERVAAFVLDKFDSKKIVEAYETVFKSL